MRPADDDEDRVVQSALRQLDHPRPAVSADAIIARAKQRRLRTPRLAAAAVLAVVAAGAAVAMPGGFVSRLFTEGEPATPSVERAPAPPVRTPASRSGSGVIVVPGTMFELDFESVQAAGEVRLHFVPDIELSVHTTGESVEYAVLPAGVEVRNTGSTTSYDVRVPEALRDLRVRVGHTLVFSKVGNVVRTRAEKAEGEGYVLSLVARR